MKNCANCGNLYRQFDFFCKLNHNQITDLNFTCQSWRVKPKKGKKKVMIDYKIRQYKDD